MHASQRLRDHHFGVRIGGENASVADLLPGWAVADRIGVVVHEPFGALGASLLIKAGISRFYSFDPQRRDQTAQYPPVFMFHVGGRYGDHSPLDFWPARREVFLPNDPYEVLGAIRDRGITRLLVPEGKNTGLDYVYSAPSGWTDLHSAREQTASTFVYSPSGHATDYDIQLCNEEKQVEEMITDVLESEALIDRLERASDQDLLNLELGPSTAADLRGFLRTYISRVDEVPRALRQHIRALRLQAAADQHITQTYRRAAVDEALGLLIPAESRLNTLPALADHPTHA